MTNSQELSIVEFLEYFATQSQEERPIFSNEDIARFEKIVGQSVVKRDPRMTGPGRDHYRFVRHQDIKDVLEAVWVERRRKEQEMLKEAA